VFPRNTVCLKNISVDTLHKGETDDDDNNNNKYKELANEKCVMRKQNAAQVIPIVISSTRVIPKLPSKILKRLNLHLNTHIKMQKSVILGTCSTVTNFLNYK
jgi:hypothetical protein